MDGGVTFRDRLVALRQLTDAICPDSRLTNERRAQILNDPVIQARSREVFLDGRMMDWVIANWKDTGLLPGFGQIQARVEKLSLESLKSPEQWRREMAKILSTFAAWAAVQEENCEQAVVTDETAV